jgi:hypothetical protein
MIQYIRNSSSEIRELEQKIAFAYMNKEQLLQIKNKKLREEQRRNEEKASNSSVRFLKELDDKEDQVMVLITLNM